MAGAVTDFPYGRSCGRGFYINSLFWLYFKKIAYFGYNLKI
jgi:hypothetical protein